ncbi:MAG: rhodanese-like domain-containing protein [Pseudomonadota bacterium]|nr:rhodanese-like domain-containing protein [Pseudomonadota bacterium]
MKEKFYKKLSPLEFIELKNKKRKWQFLDVREPWEIKISNISDSINIPMNNIEEKLDELKKDDPIAVLCRSGIRSAKVAEALINKSFTEVANIEGGINEWAQSVDQNIQQY